MLYLSSRMEVCCSSWANVDSICATCDSVELICDWLGAGPGSVVEVAAPAAPRGRSHEPRAPAISVARAIRVRPRTVFRQSTAPTCEIVTGSPVANQSPPRLPSGCRPSSRASSRTSRTVCSGSIDQSQRSVRRVPRRGRRGRDLPGSPARGVEERSLVVFRHPLWQGTRRASCAGVHPWRPRPGTRSGTPRRFGAIAPQTAGRARDHDAGGSRGDGATQRGLPVAQRLDAGPARDAHVDAGAGQAGHGVDPRRRLHLGQRLGLPLPGRQPRAQRRRRRRHHQLPAGRPRVSRPRERWPTPTAWWATGAFTTRWPLSAGCRTTSPLSGAIPTT